MADVAAHLVGLPIEAVQAFDRDLVVGSSANALSYKDLLKQNAKTDLENIASQNANAQDAYYVLFSRLIGD
jgi:hypothetical protein